MTFAALSCFHTHNVYDCLNKTDLMEAAKTKVMKCYCIKTSKLIIKFSLCVKLKFFICCLKLPTISFYYPLFLIACILTVSSCNQ